MVQRVRLLRQRVRQTLRLLQPVHPRFRPPLQLAEQLRRCPQLPGLLLPDLVLSVLLDGFSPNRILCLVGRKSYLTDSFIHHVMHTDGFECGREHLYDLTYQSAQVVAGARSEHI